MNGFGSCGNWPVLTSTKPMKRKNSTGVRRVLRAATTATKTAAQISARSVSASIIPSQHNSDAGTGDQ